MGDVGSVDNAVARSTVVKASWRILPLLGLGYLVAYMDRVNIGFAATRMNQDLHFSATIYGLGGGLFFLSYALFEIPSNLLLVRFGARRWIARIMITWGLLAVAMMFVRTPAQFYILRFLLGFAEAGFFPGVVFYLAHWFPMAERGRAISRFYAAGPLTSVVMGAVSGWLMGLDGRAALHGWQWLFLAEGSPALVVGLAVLWLLPETPAAARWLSQPEKDWLTGQLAADASRVGDPARHDLVAVLRNPLVLQLGAIGFLCIGAFYALTLSAPALLAHGAGLDVTRVGYVVSLGGVLGTAAMLATAAVSDRRGDRFGVLLASSVLVGVAYQALGLAASPAMVVGAYLLFAAAWTTVTTAQVLLWADVLPLKTLAVGSAAINSISQVGGFIGPYLWGVAKDATGSYRLGLTVLAATMLLAVVLIARLRRQVARGRSTVAAGVAPALG